MKIEDLTSLLRPDWIVMNHSVECYWFSEKSKNLPEEDVSVDYVRSSREGSRVNITNRLLEDWKKSLMKAGEK